VWTPLWVVVLNGIGRDSLMNQPRINGISQFNGKS
jgi:hypothetical protein